MHHTSHDHGTDHRQRLRDLRLRRHSRRPWRPSRPRPLSPLPPTPRHRPLVVVALRFYVRADDSPPPPRYGHTVVCRTATATPTPPPARSAGRDLRRHPSAQANGRRQQRYGKFVRLLMLCSMNCLFLSTNSSILIVDAAGWLPYGRPQRPINITCMLGNHGGRGGL